METRTFADAESLGSAAAEAIAGWIRSDVAARGRCVVAFSGGSTPEPMLRALAEADLDWSAVDILQVDERVAPDGDPDRNWTLLAETLARVVPADRLHPMPVTVPASGEVLDRDGLDAAAAAYAALLDHLGGTIDVCHLGIGPDGHTASLVPGDPVLDVRDRDVATSGPYEDRLRMTLTYPVLERSRRILWQVAEASKRAAVATLLAGGDSPAARVPQHRAVLYATHDAVTG